MHITMTPSPLSLPSVPNQSGLYQGLYLQFANEHDILSPYMMKYFQQQCTISRQIYSQWCLKQIESGGIEPPKIFYFSYFIFRTVNENKNLEKKNQSSNLQMTTRSQTNFFYLILIREGGRGAQLFIPILSSFTFSQFLKSYWRGGGGAIYCFVRNILSSEIYQYPEILCTFAKK